MLQHLCNDDLQVIEVSPKDRIFGQVSSKGNQIKWYKDGYYIKCNTWKWYEDISEVLVSYLCSFTDIKNYVEYHPCKIVEGVNVYYGCYSEGFLMDGEQDIHFARILKSKGIDMEDATFDVVRDTVSDCVGFDVKDYMGRCFCIDAITSNEDRHLNNLSVIKTHEGYRESPVYDNGLACLSDVFSYPFSNSIEENLRRVYARPFNTDFLRQIGANMITPICLNVNEFLNSVKPETKEEIRALEVIKEGLRRSEGIAWVRY